MTCPNQPRAEDVEAQCNMALRSAVFAVLREHNVSDECFAAIASITHAALSQPSERDAVLEALGAHIQADAYALTMPDDEDDAKQLRESETHWRLKARSWLSDAELESCAEAAKNKAIEEEGGMRAIRQLKAQTMGDDKRLQARVQKHLGPDAKPELFVKAMTSICNGYPPDCSYHHTCMNHGECFAAALPFQVQRA